MMFDGSYDAACAFVANETRPDHPADCPICERQLEACPGHTDDEWDEWYADEDDDDHAEMFAGIEDMARGD